MIYILILYELTKKVYTMYGLSKEIRTKLSALTLPSIGTIKPALVRLEASGFIMSQKTFSKGGRPSVYYSIKAEGRTVLNSLLKTPIKNNPAQFLTDARIRLFCADILSTSEFKELLSGLKGQAEILYNAASKAAEDNDENFYPKMVFNNLSCEYKNFISLLEGIERACKR